MGKPKGQNCQTLNHSKDLVETREQLACVEKRIIVLNIANEQLRRQIKYLNKTLADVLEGNGGEFPESPEYTDKEIP